MKTKLLLLTNGHGEDLLGALLLREIQQKFSKVDVGVFPLVGQGDTFIRQGVPIQGVQKTMPSGGFVWEGPTNLVRDVAAGLLGLVGRQWRYVSRHGGDYDGIIALGDVYPLLLGAYAGRRPLVFVPTAKSEYINGHYRWEAALMRRHALKVFPRDEATAAALRKRGVDAVFVGNLMMDALEKTGNTFGLPADNPVVAFLPGSRQDATLNCEDLFAVAEALGPGFSILLSLAPSVSPADIAQVATNQGWHVEDCEKSDHGVTWYLTKDGVMIRGVVGQFGDLLDRADIVVGLAGTGNEQAAGLGKPVVTFPGRGMQFTPKFAQAQKRLLGEAVSLIARHPRTVADEVKRILGDPAHYRRMAAGGKERMGPVGAGARMAQQIGEVFGI